MYQVAATDKRYLFIYCSHAQKKQKKHAECNHQEHLYH